MATRFGFDLPPGVKWPNFVGMGMASGIGFTVSIFVAGLAFDDATITDLGKIGILVASAAAAVLALAIIAFSADDEHPETAGANAIDNRS